jgi:outer membrane protein assembly factor BamB
MDIYQQQAHSVNLYWLRDNTSNYELVRSVVEYGCSYTSPPMIYNGDIYIGRVHVEYGIPMGLNIFDFATGADTTVGGRSKLHTCISVDTSTGLIYTGYDGSGLQCRGSESWSTPSYWAAHPDGIYGVTSSPAVIDSVVIFGSEQGKLHFFQKNNVTWPNNTGGIEVWSYVTPTDRPIQSSPAVSDGKVVFGGLDGYLYGLWDGTEVTAPVPADSGATVERQGLTQPGKWTLSVFPNPSSNRSINIRIQGLNHKARLVIYDIRGTLIRDFKRSDMTQETIKWDGNDMTGKRVSAGRYFAVLKDRLDNKVHSFNLNIIN